MVTTTSLPKPIDPLHFELPPALEATAPPEARGLARDDVRLMVSYRQDNRIIHATFRDLPCFLEAGDLLVINTSRTLPAALDAIRRDERPVTLHLSTQLPAGLWLVELRQPTDKATCPLRDGQAGEVIRFPAGGTATLHAPYGNHNRLWLTTFNLPMPLYDYLHNYGYPIRYYYVEQSWPLDYYQTIYANEAGSAEMPSAGRAFTPELFTQLVARGIIVAPLLLHTGVASLDEHEPPYEEYYRIPAVTAQLVNWAKKHNRRIIAVGTTVVRALESVGDERGQVHPAEGWTPLIITPQRGLRVVNGLLTGLHEPEASHLAMLEALSGREHLGLTYQEALREHYLWHEFGDLHLILP